MQCFPRGIDEPHSCRADGSDRADQYPGRLHLRPAAGSAAARPRHRLLHPGPARAARRQGVRDRAAAQGARSTGRPFHPGRAVAGGAHHLRRGAAAAGPAVRSRLRHHHASARTHPSQDAGRQRPGAGAQRTREDVRDGISRPDAADADHPRPRRDQGVPRRARRHRDEAALRQGRRGGVPAGAGRPQLRLALRSCSA